MDQPNNTGRVYLVGAGPGAPDLITVRGLRLLQQADVVAYDRLVHPDLVDEAHPAAEKIYVGKSPERPSCSQHDINTLLVDKARAGAAVVRLKGGDAFVFGRGGEEALALEEAGVPFEIVPGLTSAVSAPAFAGVPVTHRGVSSAFTVVTGHTCKPDDADLDWAALAEAGTLVVLMGLRRLPRIAAALIEHGQSPDTPAAVVQAASTDDQEVVHATLETIGEHTRHLSSPATVVIGEVARLGRELAWFRPGCSGRAVFPEGHRFSSPVPLPSFPPAASA